jgi:phosphatidylethanolamine/phosphatidyl-N-methylethanolamine N-methyltransferase
MNIAARDFAHIGSIFPSSLCSARSVVKHVDPQSQLVVEYGPGTGIITREILRRLSPKSELVGVEVNQDCLSQLRQIKDKRFRLVEGDVRDTVLKMGEIAPDGADAVVTGIPFSLMTLSERKFIVEKTLGGLRKGGKLIAYQNSWALMFLLKSYAQRVEVFFEPRNFLPYVITVATRH